MIKKNMNIKVLTNVNIFLCSLSTETEKKKSAKYSKYIYYFIKQRKLYKLQIILDYKIESSIWMTFLFLKIIFISGKNRFYDFL